MKKLLLLLPLVVLFAACSKKETAKPALTPQTATAADILGKWQLTTDTTYVTQNGQTTITPGDATSTNGFLVYEANGVGYSMSNGQIAENYTYSVSAGVIKHTVTTNNSGQEEDFSIITISTTQMLIRNTQGSGYIDVLLKKQ